MALHIWGYKKKRLCKKTTSLFIINHNCLSSDWIIKLRGQKMTSNKEGQGVLWKAKICFASAHFYLSPTCAGTGWQWAFWLIKQHFGRLPGTHLGELVPRSCVNDWAATSSYYTSTGGRNLLLWQYRHDVSWMDFHGSAKKKDIEKHLHIVDFVFFWGGDKFRRIICVARHSRLCRTSTLWAIKPFNGLNAVHKTPIVYGFIH